MTQPVSGDGLREYLERRAQGQANANEPPMFVLQQHLSDEMHFDLRFEAGRRFVSWALPDAPWPHPEAKRAAVPSADYPLERATFEGSNPPDVFGGGVVLLWDAGSYRLLGSGGGPDPNAMDEAVDRGKLQVWLDGWKLHGGWNLMRSGEENAWVLEKMHDEYADPDADLPNRWPESVLSGRRIEDLTGIHPTSPRTFGDRGEEGNLHESREPDA